MPPEEDTPESCPSPVQGHHTMFTSLPAELILCISNFLDSPELLPDLICFSLCNHRLYELLLPRRRQSDLFDHYKISFLERISHDHPEYFACDMCMILHRYDGSESFGLTSFGGKMDNQLPCMNSKAWLHQNLITSDHSDNYYAPPFSFIHLKLAMRRFRYGKQYGISTDSLSYTTVTCGNLDALFLVSRDVQICPDPPSLYMRIQAIVVVSLLADFTAQLSKEWYPRCFGSDIYHIISQITGLFSEFQIISFTCTCSACNTDLHIEICPFDSKIAIIITKWRNLGEGRTPEDWVWGFNTKSQWSDLCLTRQSNNHFLLFPGERDEWRNSDCYLYNFSRRYQNGVQDHRARFENMAKRSFEELKLVNLSYLRDEEYRRIMPRIIPGKWMVDFKEPSSSPILEHWRSAHDPSYLFRDDKYIDGRIERESRFWKNDLPRKDISPADCQILFDMMFFHQRIGPPLIWNLEDSHKLRETVWILGSHRLRETALSGLW